MNTEIAQESSLLAGCDRCWPESAEAAWSARSDVRERAMWIDEAHFNIRGLECPHCTRRFVSVFTETIDWSRGDDGQSWTMAPVTLGEFERVEALLASSIEAALHVVPSGRRSLRRDHPSGGDARTFWATGIGVAFNG
ncbi:hypothetical protein [Paraburkholderia diazotrophica]|nr:hypothetical protein [Paraburkholderia diazotrophica]